MFEIIPGLKRNKAIDIKLCQAGFQSAQREIVVSGCGTWILILSAWQWSSDTLQGICARGTIFQLAVEPKWFVLGLKVVDFD